MNELVTRTEHRLYKVAGLIAAVWLVQIIGLSPSHAALLPFASCLHHRQISWGFTVVSE
jgi:hypothetical protein